MINPLNIIQIISIFNEMAVFSKTKKCEKFGMA